MAWTEFFYSTNIPFATAQSASFKKAVKMMSKIRRSYLPLSYHDIHKRLLNETKNKMKAQIVERTKMFIRTHNATFTGDDWNSVNNHPFLDMMYVSPAGEEFLEAINTSGHMKDVVYIAIIIKRYNTTLTVYEFVHIKQFQILIHNNNFISFKKINR